MQIIDELEPQPVVPSLGDSGLLALTEIQTWPSPWTMVISADGPPENSTQAGAGVVSDSIPSAEFEETDQNQKLRAGRRSGRGNVQAG